MKRIFSLILGLLALVSVQAQDPCKIGYIDRTALLANMPEVAQVEAQLSQLNILYTKEYDRMTAEYNEKVKAYMATSKSLSEPIKLARQAEITEYEERMALYKKRYTEEIKKQTTLLWNPIHSKVKQAIETVAKAQGVSIVLDQATPLYVSASCMDLLPLVKQELGIQ